MWSHKVLVDLYCFSYYHNKTNYIALVVILCVMYNKNWFSDLEYNKRGELHSSEFKSDAMQGLVQNWRDQSRSDVLQGLVTRSGNRLKTHGWAKLK